MPSQELDLPFPILGLAKNRGYQSSERQTTRSASNVVSDDSEESRTRGGSRPGLTKRYQSSMEETPLYIVRVSAGSDTRVPEYIVAGTVSNVFVGKSLPSGTVVPITYTESLAPLSGELCTEAGETILTEASDEIIIDEFDLVSINRDLVVQYQGTVILGAEESVVQSGTESTATVEGTGGDTTTLDDSGIADWTALGIDPEIHWVDIESTSADVADGTYKIASVASGSVTLTGNVFGSGATDGPDACDFTIRVGVRELDPETPTVDLLTPTGGIVPSDADAVTVYRDRLVWGAGRTWYMSRQGDAGDYDYASDPEDPARAINGSASEAGQPADPIVALVTAGYDYMLIFTETSVWNMRGDPGFGGQLYRVSGTVGCVGAKAWCYGETTDVFFLAKDGLYYMAPNAGGIESLSPETLPRELRGVDRDNFYVTLAYDPDDNGVLIMVVPKTAEAGSHYWFDVDTRSLWPVRFSVNSHQPVSAVTFGGNPLRNRRIVLASIDGYVREWSGTTDDGTEIGSHVVLGPYPMAGERDFDGILSELVGVTDLDSASVTVEVYVGRTSEEAADAAIAGTSPDWSGTLPAGRSYTHRPRRRGNAFCVRLEATGAWAFESMFAKLAVAGKTRR